MPSSRLAAAALLAVAIAGKAWAADTDLDAKLRDQLRTTTMALREAQDQNATLTAKQAELTAQLAAANQQITDLKAKPPEKPADQGQLAAAQDAAKQSEAAAAQARAMLDKWQVAYKQAADVARARDAAAKDFEVRLKRSAAGLELCTSKNAALEKLGFEMLDKLGHRTLFTDFAETEPVTQIYRVKLENLLQDYRDKLRDQEVQP